MTSQTIGLVGTGIMGLPMGSNLLRAGYPLLVFNRTKDKAKPLIAQGARWADSPAAITRQSDVVITMVTDSPDVQKVYLADEGIVGGIKPGALCIDMTTASPELARRLAEALKQRSCGFLDAPVSGGKTGAEAGTLSIMVGGDADDLRRGKPILEAMAKTIVHCGPAGTGQLTKLCNQIVVGLNLLAACECLVFARQAGLDPQVVLQAVSKGAAGSWALDNLAPRMLARDFAPMFMIDLQQKDLRMALEAASASKAPLPGTALVHQLLGSNQAFGEGREGIQALVKTLERLAYLSVLRIQQVSKQTSISASLAQTTTGLATSIEVPRRLFLPPPRCFAERFASPNAKTGNLRQPLLRRRRESKSQEPFSPLNLRRPLQRSITASGQNPLTEG